MALRKAGAHLSSPEEAIAQQLIAEVDQFNIETTGISDVRDLLVTETDEKDELLGGVYGWSWGGTWTRTPSRRPTSIRGTASRSWGRCRTIPSGTPTCSCAENSSRSETGADGQGFEPSAASPP
jgi:hypothetical protein